MGSLITPGGIIGGRIGVPSWLPSYFGSRRAVDLDAEVGCYTDAAVAFDGVNQALSRASEAALQTGDIDFCVCGWVWVDDLDTNDLIGKNSEFALLTDGGASGKPCMYLNATDRANWTGAWSTGAWHFVYGYYDSTAQRCGVSADNAAVVDTAVITPPSVGADPFCIGNRAGNVVPLPGRAGRAGFWKRLLTPSELTWLYNAGAGRFAAEYGVAGTDGAALLTSIVDAWDGSERTGAVAGQINGLDLTRVNGPGVAQGPTGKARLLNGTDQYLTNSSASIAVGAGDAHWAGWVYLTTNTGNPAFFGKYGAGGDIGFLVWYQSGTGFTFSASDDGTAVVEIADSATRATGSWYFVEAKYTRSTKKVGIAVNGGAFTESAALTTAGIFVSSVACAIGKNMAGLGYLNGAAARLGMWQRLLTDAERRDLYRGGEGRLYANLPSSLIDSSLVFYLDGTEASGTLVDQHAGRDFTAVNGPTTTAGPGISGRCVDRSPCKRIEDSSGYKRHYIQPTLAVQPDWIADAVNGRPALYNDGVRWMYAAEAFTMAQPLAWFSVLKYSTAGVVNVAMLYGPNAASPAVYASGANFRMYAGVEITADPDDTAWHTHATIFNGAASQYRLDGAANSLSGNPGTYGFISQVRTLFSNREASAFAAGYIAAAFLVEGEPTEAEIVDASRYYRTRYGTA